MRYYYRKGDVVIVTAVPPLDPLPPDDDELPTRALFAACVGKAFTVTGAFKGELELEPGRNREIRARFGRWHFIWIAPSLVKLRRRAKRPR